MKTIILSAGQGRRMLPLTVTLPKCLLSVRGKTLLEWQIDTLHKCGIYQIVVVTGYGADHVDKLIRQHYEINGIKLLYNPDYATADNLVSCWAARHEMTEDFILLNGDTLFEPAVLKTLLASPDSPITVTVSSNDNYDADDMKVIIEGSRLVNIGKKLPLEKVNGESIGLILFRGKGPEIFRNAIKSTLKYPDATRKWYLAVIAEIAAKIPVMTCSVNSLRWCEVDYPKDLKEADRLLSTADL